LVKITNKILEPFLNTSNTRCLHSEPSCDSATYRSLLRRVHKANIDSKMKAAEVCGSVDMLATVLHGLKVHIYLTCREPNKAQDYGRCFKKDIEKEVEVVLASIGNPVLTSHIRYMEIQRVKLDRGD
jgi:hypothetical protein